MVISTIDKYEPQVVPLLTESEEPICICSRTLISPPILVCDLKLVVDYKNRCPITEVPGPYVRVRRTDVELLSKAKLNADILPSIEGCAPPRTDS